MSDTESSGEEVKRRRSKKVKSQRYRKPGGLKPCERCKAQHLKCVYDDGNDVCQRCGKSGHDCVRLSKKIRFREMPMSKFKQKDDSTATRLDSSKTKEPSSASEHSQHGPSATGAEVTEVLHSASTSRGDEMETDGTRHNSNHNYRVSDKPNGEFHVERQYSFEEFEQVQSRPTLQSLGSDFIQVQRNGPLLGATDILTNSPSNAISENTDIFNPLTRFYSNDILSPYLPNSPYMRRMPRSNPTQFLDHLVKPSSLPTSNDPRKYLETVLLRYFHEELAPWFDLCDPDSHFANVVPQRARQAGPLRSALLTIAARNLCRNKRFRSKSGVVQWRGRVLPGLTEEIAVEYHNKCIEILSQLSTDPKKLHDEDLLAAVIALRTDEELGHNSTDDEEDQELFLKISSMFVNTQLPAYLALPHSSPTVFLPLHEEANASNQPSPSNVTESDLGVSGLRQACFWTAFRQDLHASFLRQHPVRFPLLRCEAFRQLTPATDAVWANRMVTFCADVLEFCYGSDSVDAKVAPAYTNQQRWRELKAHEESLCSQLPATFEPTYCSEPDASNGKVFPEIWYLESTHVSGTTYVELARMLLNVFDPTRPKLGHGFLAATNAFIQSTKRILFRLCGIALSNHHCPPSLINACLGISMFGEYFDDLIEQQALLGVLALMHDRYAYPTNQIANSLRRAWNNEDISGSPFGHVGIG